MHARNFEPLVGVEQNVRLSINSTISRVSFPDPSLAPSESGKANLMHLLKFETLVGVAQNVGLSLDSRGGSGGVRWVRTNPPFR